MKHIKPKFNGRDRFVVVSSYKNLKVGQHLTASDTRVHILKFLYRKNIIAQDGSDWANYRLQRRKLTDSQNNSIPETLQPVTSTDPTLEVISTDPTLEVTSESPVNEETVIEITSTLPDWLNE